MIFKKGDWRIFQGESRIFGGTVFQTMYVFSGYTNHDKVAIDHSIGISGRDHGQTLVNDSTCVEILSTQYACLQGAQSRKRGGDCTGPPRPCAVGWVS